MGFWEWLMGEEEDAEPTMFDPEVSDPSLQWKAAQYEPPSFSALEPTTNWQPNLAAMAGYDTPQITDPYDQQVSFDVAGFDPLSLPESEVPARRAYNSAKWLEEFNANPGIDPGNEETWTWEMRRAHAENEALGGGGSTFDYSKSMGQVPEENVNPEFAENYPGLNKLISGITQPLQTFFETPWVERSGQSGAEIMTLTDNPNKTSTGSKFGDISADLFGGLMGFLPSGGTSAGAGLWGTTEELVGKGMSKIPRLSTLNPVLQTGAKLGATSVPYEGIVALANDREFSAGEAAQSAGLNAILGMLTHGMGRLGKAEEPAVRRVSEPEPVTKSFATDMPSLRTDKESIAELNDFMHRDLTPEVKPLGEVEPVRETVRPTEIEESVLVPKKTVVEETVVPRRAGAKTPVDPHDFMHRPEVVGDAAEMPLPEGVGAASLQPPSTIETITSKTEKPPILERIAPANVVNAIKKAYYKTVDGYNRLNDIDRLYIKRTGRRLPANERSFILAHNTSNSEAIAQRNLTDFMVDKDGNVVGDSLLSVVRQVPKNKWRQFEDYLKLNHYKAWEREGMEVYSKDINITPYMADKKIAQYEAANPWMKQAAADYTQWINTFSEKWLVDTGLVSPDAWAAMRAKYKDYIPMQRLLSDAEDIMPTSAKKALADQPNPVKRAKGSERQTIESLETMIERVPAYIKASKRNEVMQNVIRQIREDPEGMSAFGEIITPETGNISMPNVVTARVGGERVYVKVNDLPLLDAITGLSPAGQNLILEGFRAVTRVMKILTTGINPVFSLGRNIIRDLPMSYVASKSTNNPVVWAKDVLGAVVDMVGNREAYRSFKAVGGGQASPIATERNLLAESKRKLLGNRSTADLVKNIINTPFTVLEKIADVTEMAPRLGEYRRIIRQEGDTAATRQKALFEAKDITGNFWKTRTAELTSFADAFVPYLGAACQGLDKLGRTYKDQPLAAIGKSFAAITLPTIVLYSINHDNPDYQKLSNWTRDTNFLIPLANGTFAKLPKPREGGVVFGALIERLLGQYKDRDPDAFSMFVKTIAKSFLPPDPLFSNIASPIISNIPSNEDFAGRAIVPSYMKSLSPGQQYDEKTTGLAKWLGKMFPNVVSPKHVDYLMRSYLGVIGQVLPAISEGNVKDALARMFTADPAYSQDAVSRFYDKKQKADTAQADAKKQGAALVGNDEKMRKLYGKISDNISDISKAMREVQADKKLGPEAKKAKLRGMQLGIVTLAEIANKSTGEQLKVYDRLKKEGKIEEAKPLSTTQQVKKTKDEQKKSDEMFKLLTKK